jgi:hypothetical protein
MGGVGGVEKDEGDMEEGREQECNMSSRGRVTRRGVQWRGGGGRRIGCNMRCVV